jgi:hypothetical protein
LINWSLLLTVPLFLFLFWAFFFVIDLHLFRLDSGRGLGFGSLGLLFSPSQGWCIFCDSCVSTSFSSFLFLLGFLFYWFDLPIFLASLLFSSIFVGSILLFLSHFGPPLYFP